MSIKISILSIISLLVIAQGCRESERFEINYADTTPPGKPIISEEYKPLYGGARIYFTPPEDEDVLTVDARYTNQKGETIWFSASYYTDSIDVEGFADTNPKNVTLYAVDRAGNKSETQTITVIPKEPAVARVASSINVKGGFSSFYLDWKNELKQVVNIHVSYSYEGKEKVIIYTSTDTLERKYIRLDNISETTPVNVKVKVEDRYGNTSDLAESSIYMIKDEKIPKDRWVIPITNDSIGGVPQGYWDAYEGRMIYITDDIIDNGLNWNWGSTGPKGHTGNIADGNLPANFIIDLGEEWEISRIVTHQRDLSWSAPNIPTGRGWYYGNENIGIYSMYIWDAVKSDWDSICTHKIVFPPDLPGQQYRVMAQAGDMAYLYVENPHFSAPTRWFRYEARFGFNNDYTSQAHMGLSEITLYGRKKTN
ncbi:MAG: DUF4959 domain-containing protein [Dysgonamonadaceae bacterium]|jgi:hypothetical protein|nr:DUF4959 domain-containing protein [Dysgonamonadaceae bacterium]